MASNDVKNGGSFYLQSKVYRAKEMLDEYQAEKENPQQQEEQDANENSSSNDEANNKATK